MTTTVPCVEIEPRNPANASIIWLHGLGATGHDFEPIVPELRLPELFAVRFVFPHAPSRAITVNNGYVMPAWFNILSFERGHPVDESGIQQSITTIHSLIRREEQRNIPSHRILLAGFSQGGVIAIHAALRYPKPLCGIMALSTYLPLTAELTEAQHHANRAIPIFIAHGRYDPVLPLPMGQAAYQYLHAQGYAAAWHEYSMGHHVCDEEITDLSQWLKTLPGLQPPQNQTST